jgi:hypothetical protein
MPSPFPGMNPYLEHPDTFHDFHQAFVPAMRAVIAKAVRPRFAVRMDTNVYIHERSYDERRMLGRPDVAIHDRERIPVSGLSSVATPSPTVIEHPVGIDELHESFLEIRDRQSHHVVTIIELLSPANKRPGPDREQYLSKRRRIIRSSTNLVEIDLLRDGPPMPDDRRKPCDYSVMVSRPAQRPAAGFWPIGLRDPLPVVPIPLATDAADLPLDLQSLFHTVYDDHAYGDSIDRRIIDPPLAPDDAAWAAAIVANAATLA